MARVIIGTNGHTHKILMKTYSETHKDQVTGCGWDDSMEYGGIGVRRELSGMWSSEGEGITLQEESSQYW